MASPADSSSVAPSVAPCVVAVFARAPVPGATKTRLIPSLGPEGASDLHRWMLHRTLTTAVEADVGPVELWCSPTTDHSYFRECERGFGISLRCQSEGDIGQRMSAAAEDIFRRSAGMILIGTDCPAMTSDDLRHSAAALEQGYDAVFLPVEDGGYTLIALGAPAPGLFSGIDWSTDRVMPQTRHRLRTLDLRWLELAMRWDLDRPEDLARLHHV